MSGVSEFWIFNSNNFKQDVKKMLDELPPLAA